MKKRITSVVLTLVLFFAPYNAVDLSAININESSAEETVGNNENVYNKIHFYFDESEHGTIDDIDELESAVLSVSAQDGVALLVNTDVNQDIENEITVTIEFASDFMETEQYIAFSNERETIDSPEELLDFRKRLNGFSKEYHEELILQNVDILSVLDYTEIESIGYSPFVVLKMDGNDLEVGSIITLCESEDIENISLGYEVVPEEEASWIDTMTGINAYDIVTNGTYTGDGIRIGVYESGGVCDITNTNLAGKNITIRDSSVATTPHATEVTALLSIIAPDADYYVSDVCDVGIAWFIQQNCDIINCSFGYFYNIDNHDGTYSEGTFGYRYDNDAVYDYQVTAHFVTICKSAGNINTNNTKASYNPYGKITSPGYAYNVITVGGVDRVLVSGQYKWMHESSACYKCSEPVVKPNVSAPNIVTVPNIGRCEGTSYASPQVAGCIALLMESDSQYRLSPEKVLATVTSTAQETYGYSGTIGEFDNKVGAGIVNLERMIDNDVVTYAYNTSGIAQTTVISRNVYLTAGAELQVGLAWLAIADLNPTTVYVTNYDLYVYGPNGGNITSTLTSSNVEMLRIPITTTGTYRIVVYQAEDINVDVSGDYISLAYNY